MAVMVPLNNLIQIIPTADTEEIFSYFIANDISLS